MGRSLRFRSATIALALLLSIAGTTPNGVSLARGADMQRIDSIVLDELDILEASAGAICQAMLAMQKQSIEERRDQRRMKMVEQEQKLRAGQGPIDADRREVEKEIQAAKDARNAAIIAAMASCTVVVSGVATTGNNVHALYGAPDEQRLHDSRQTQMC